MTQPRHVITILAVSDLDRAVRFYRDAFGWETSVEVPVFVQFKLPDGPSIALYQRDAFAVNTGVLPANVDAAATTATEVYLYCDDLDAAIARITSAGGRQLAPRAAKPWGDDAAYFTDPDGNVLALACHGDEA